MLDRYISNVVNKNNFLYFFIYFDIICIKIFDVDNIIEKVVCDVFDFITHF